MAFSVSKVVTSFLLARSKLPLDTPITTYIPELADRDPQFSRVTLADLVDMRSGIEFDEETHFPWVDQDAPRVYYATDLEHTIVAEPVIEVAEPKGAKRLTARTGVYDPDAHRLVLQGGVRMTDPSGSQLASESATIDTRTGAVQSQAGLHANNDVGQVTSKAYDIQDNGDRVVFKGGVRGRLNAR